VINEKTITSITKLLHHYGEDFTGEDFKGGARAGDVAYKYKEC